MSNLYQSSKTGDQYQIVTAAVEAKVFGDLDTGVMELPIVLSVRSKTACENTLYPGLHPPAQRAMCAQ